MWGKPADASAEVTGDWFVIPLSYAYDGPQGLVGPFASQSLAWDWIEDRTRNLKLADGGVVCQPTKPD